MTPYEQGKIMAARIVGTTLEETAASSYREYGLTKWRRIWSWGARQDWKVPVEALTEFMRGFEEIMLPRFRPAA